MGSIGANKGSTVSTTKENAYGFEVSNNTEFEFSNSTWEEMSELRSYGAFEDSQLRSLVDDRISELVEQYGDLYLYDADVTVLAERLENSNVTSDEYWTAYHLMAKRLGIQPPRYTVLDNSEYAWDTRYSSVEQAEQWANEHDGAYIYDTWTRKMKKIGAKNWRKA